MKERNAAFFGLYENLFIVLKEELGEEKALEMFRRIMERGLKAAYDASSFERGNENSFVSTLKQRDESVGLRVNFPVVTKNKIIYQFLDDPFPGLKNAVDFHKLDDTYISFKVRYLLGEGWTYKTTKHIWKNDPYIEHVITKS
ncbi:MAG: hypothetical protein NTY68_00715 [Candidatus Micrarchaeota archaeon]|nr:hypothetical protein [Candidatus Micrarchaeota archaeon]